jgi:hypothetical protein
VGWAGNLHLPHEDIHARADGRCYRGGGDPGGSGDEGRRAKFLGKGAREGILDLTNDLPWAD